MNEFSSLDLYIHDIQHQPLSEKILSDVYNMTIHKLENAGFYKEYDIRLISRYSFDFPALDIRCYTNEFCPDKIVLLFTFSANGTYFITPPYDKGEHTPISWNKWLLRMGRGEQLSLLITAPWAQAKFINVGMEY